MIKIDHATFTYGENNEYSVGIRASDLEIEMVRLLCYVGRQLWKNNTHSNDQWVDSTI